LTIFDKWKSHLQLFEAGQNLKKIVIERVLQMAMVLVTFPERKVTELTTHY